MQNVHRLYYRLVPRIFGKTSRSGRICSGIRLRAYTSFREIRSIAQWAAAGELTLTVGSIYQPSVCSYTYNEKWIVPPTFLALLRVNSA